MPGSKTGMMTSSFGFAATGSTFAAAIISLETFGPTRVDMPGVTQLVRRKPKLTSKPSIFRIISIPFVTPALFLGYPFQLAIFIPEPRTFFRVRLVHRRLAHLLLEHAVVIRRRNVFRRPAAPARRYRRRLALPGHAPRRTTLLLADVRAIAGELAAGGRASPGRIAGGCAAFLRPLDAGSRSR